MSWLLLLATACSYQRAPDQQQPGSDGAQGDGPGDGPTSDGSMVTDGPEPDGPPPDARDCSMIAAPAGCTPQPFGCAGSASCFVLCTNARNFGNAKGACGPGTLAVPSTDAELQCTKDFMVAFGGGDNVWIGLEQLNSPTTPEEKWFWVDTTPVVLDGWGTNQPDDSNGTENNTENCGNLEIAFGFAWNDDVCGESHRYMCELP